MADEEEPRRIVSAGRLRKRRKDGWTRRDERVFLKHYRATCNFSASARAAGKSPSSAFDLRDRDGAFAADCDSALRHGRMRLHGKLIVFAETSGREIPPGDDGEPGEPDMKDFDPDLALKVLKFHEGPAGGRGRPQPERASEEELLAVILELLDALDRRRKKKRIWPE